MMHIILSIATLSPKVLLTVQPFKDQSAEFLLWSFQIPRHLEAVLLRSRQARPFLILWLHAILYTVLYPQRSVWGSLTKGHL